MTDTQRVLIPEEPASVHYQALTCGNVDRDRAAEVARADAEALGRRPHTCITNEWNGPDDGDRREAVSA